MRCAEKIAAAYVLGQRDALAAAREAVAALPYDPLNRDQGPAATQRQAIAAIDALRRKENDEAG